jgi:hypothetical protein
MAGESKTPNITDTTVAPSSTPDAVPVCYALALYTLAIDLCESLAPPDLAVLRALTGVGAALSIAAINRYRRAILEALGYVPLYTTLADFVEATAPGLASPAIGVALALAALVPALGDRQAQHMQRAPADYAKRLIRMAYHLLGEQAAPAYVNCLLSLSHTLLGSGSF